ncbi:cupin domain-containing protein [Streptomyces sp. AV19]|uniref:cupin domain-containing protein n=1 Tax=Streptomyces sp. AV19 TaxID=2793068 RepID=UPI0018FEB527|nr:cupin domain-containing protein [Streptomyces sp. AV19]MBH1937881.1 cupin domain-containing protein [Streptomyces sp. AV19]MDG4536520.1 cupin domain-containing protein [Streptomyces sp. AV19]
MTSPRNSVHHRSGKTTAPRCRANPRRVRVNGAGRTAEPLVEDLATGCRDAGADLRFRGPEVFGFRRITIPPGGSTGWHYHDGRLLAVVGEGTLTRYEAAGGGPVRYAAGQALVEPSGPDTAHVGVNEGPGPLVLYVLYLGSLGDPPARPVPEPALRER